MAANKPNSKSWASRAFREGPLSFIWKGEKTAPRLLEETNKEYVELYVKIHPTHAVIRKPSTSEIASYPRIVAVLSFIGMNGGYKHVLLEIFHMDKPYDLHYILTNLGGNKDWEIMYNINYENENDYFNVSVPPNNVPNKSTISFMIRYGDTSQSIKPEKMNRPDVEEFLIKHRNWLVIRKASEDAISTGRYNNQHREIYTDDHFFVLSFIDRNNEIRHIPIHETVSNENDIISIVESLGAEKGRITSILTEKYYLNKKDPLNLTTAMYRQGGRRSKKSKTRRSKKSKGCSRRHRK